MATPFFLIGASPQHPLKSICNFSRPRKTSPHGLSHFIKSPYFWWSSHFSHIKISQQEPEIKNADFNRSWEDFLSGVFQIHRKLLLFMKAPQKENKTFYRKEKNKTKMKQCEIRTRTQPRKPTILTTKPLTNGKMGDS